MATHYTTVAVVALFCLVCLNSCASGERKNVVSKLVDDLRKSNPHIEYMPIVATSNSTEPVEVQFDIHLLNIAYACPIRKEVTLDAWAYMHWNTFTSWKPEDYSGVERIIVPEKYIWMPDITAYEAVTPLTNLVHDGVILSYNGWATFKPKVRFTVLCDVDAHKLASNISCHINFGFWNNDNSLTSIKIAGDMDHDPEMKHYFEGSRYEVTAHSAEKVTHYFHCCPASENTALQFNLSFKEKIPSPVMNGFVQGMFGMH